jgi:hypothetical protein
LSRALCRETGKVRATETVGDRALILVDHGPSRKASRGRVGSCTALPQAANRSRMTGPDGAVLGPRP